MLKRVCAGQVHRGTAGAAASQKPTAPRQCRERGKKSVERKVGQGEKETGQEEEETGVGKKRKKEEREKGR